MSESKKCKLLKMASKIEGCYNCIENKYNDCYNCKASKINWFEVAEMLREYANMQV